jgi:hypothetical protein
MPATVTTPDRRRFATAREHGDEAAHAVVSASYLTDEDAVELVFRRSGLDPCLK